MNNLNVMRGSGVLLLLLSLFVSCNDSNTDITNKNQITSILPAKSVNPYENVGVQHNIILAKISNQTAKMSNYQANDFVNKYFAKAIDSIHNSNSSVTINKDGLQISEIDLSNYKTPNQLVKSFKTNILSIKNKPLIFGNASLFSIDKVSQEIENSLDSMKKKKNIQEVFDEIDKRERKVNDVFTKEESDVVFVTYAVMRNSLSYWTSNKLNQNINSANKPMIVYFDESELWFYIELAAMDGFSAALGAITGGNIPWMIIRAAWSSYFWYMRNAPGLW